MYKYEFLTMTQIGKVFFSDKPPSRPLAGGDRPAEGRQAEP